MPADLAEALNKKGGLTLTQLAIYDDILTDALVDRVYFWAKIRKVRQNARPCRGIREQDVCKILQQNVIIEKDSAKAQKAMLAQPGFQNYMRSLRTEDEKEHFERHLRKYINIYLPDCPFEVCTTHRYTITTAEACVVARKSIKAGEVIKYLSGIQVEMTEEEEAGLSSRTDFSIVLSSRRKRPSLFLGPARFANHDCDSNARLTTTGPHGIMIVARRAIAVGEEITVKYGDDYFGEDNCECLCGTCEQHMRNGWDPQGPILHDSSSDDESEEENDNDNERPRKRQRVADIFDSTSQPVEKRVVAKSAPLKRKRDQVFIKQEPGTEIPRKRGRPRKWPLAADKVNTGLMDNAYSFLAQWFQIRARQPGVEDLDMTQVKQALLDHGFASLFTERDIPNDKRHYGSLQKVLEAMCAHESAALLELEGKMAALKAENAKLLGIMPEDAEKYYSPPGHENHVPLPTPPPSRAGRGLRSAAKCCAPATEQPREKTPEVQEADRSRRDRSRLSPGNSRLSAMRRQHTSSPLRKVVSAIDSEADEDTTEQPVITKEKAHAAALLRVETTQNSATDDSSRSSIFSNENLSEPTSPPSSNEDMEPFAAAGNICQNIVDLYTRDEELDIEDAIQQQLQSEHAVTEQQPVKRGRGRPPKHRPGQAVVSIEKSHDEPTKEEPLGEHIDENGDRRGPPRTPGDYHLTSTLLIDINDRWIECRNCDEYFVQHDAYQTRIACPRCERHSKLYGYHWPKTDKTGKDDKEERILDHRQIHRFIDPDEEKQERKGRKTLAEVLKERELSASQDSESQSRSGTREDSRRRSRRIA